MLKLIEFIRIKSITDTSMAMALTMIQENPGQGEECLLALFQSMYETNLKLANEVVRLRDKKTSKVTLL